MSSPAPLVSIALPVRNAEPWIRECIDSIALQTEARFEVVAVDDASTDRSREILDGWRAADPRIRVLETSGAKRGIAAALNLALASAYAPYLMRMDADDRMHPRRIARQLAALERDPSLFGVSCRATAISDGPVTDGMQAYLDWQNSLLGPEEIARDRFIESPVLHPSVMLRTEVVRRVMNGWRDVEWPEDWDFFLRAFEAGLRIARVPEVLVEWRLHDLQSTRTHASYGDDALASIRAHFLARRLQGVVGDDRSLYVLGAGPVGKALVKSLALSGVVANGLADVDARKIGGVVRGAGQRWRVVDYSTLAPMRPRPFAISAVAGADARCRVRAALAEWGWIEGDDFVVAA